MATPYVTIVRNVVPSTQDLAAEELEAKESAVLVVAGKQTAGRGRTGNVWWQAPESVAASLAFRPEAVPVDETFPLAVGLFVREAIRATSTVDVRLKWPNDIERDGRKVGGILVERTDRHVVVGCGLNLWWPNPPEGVGALVDSEPRPELGKAISELWAAAVLDPELQWDRNAYLGVCSTIGAQVTWEPDGAGVVVTVDEQGRLVVDTEQGQVSLLSGEVRAVRSDSDDVSTEGVSNDGA